MFYFKSHPTIIKHIPNTRAEIFLTFDDGPSPDLTEKVLDILREEKAVASFFVIGLHAEQFPDIIRRIKQEGHAVLSHSIDHNYKNYFQKEDGLEVWLRGSLQHLEKMTGELSKIFRPPAGVITPPLVRAAEKLGLQLILWNHRFFDTTMIWTLKKANRALNKLTAGDIILLHDKQKASHHKQFLLTLRHFICEAHRKNFVFSILR